MDAIAAQRLKCERLRQLAHEAPMNIYHLNHDGHRWVEQISYAWADRAREWAEACDKLDQMIGENHAT